MPRCLSFVLVLLGVSVQYCRAQPSPGRGVSRPMPCGSVMAPERAYSLRLTSFVSGPHQVSGLILDARIDGGPPLHLLLDSGAARITLGARASAKSAISPFSESHLAGFGEWPARSARFGVAGAVDVGPLRFGNCRVNVAHSELAAGIDGLIPMSLFGGFLIRLDLPGKAMDLTPYPDRDAARTAGSARAIRRGGLLFVRGALNDALKGYIFLDTGASYSAISQRTARVLKSKPVSAIALQGAGGAVNGDLIAGRIRYHVASQSLTAETVVALDLKAFSAFNRVETIGILGYPALRAFILTVSYRDALVRIDAPPN